VSSVEAKVREHLEREGLGMPYKESMSVKAILAAVFMNQGGWIRGDLQSSLDTISKTVFDMTKLQLETSAVTGLQSADDIDGLKRENTDLKHDIHLLKCDINNLRSENQLQEQRTFQQEQRISLQEQRIIDLLAVVESLQSRVGGREMFEGNTLAESAVLFEVSISREASNASADSLDVLSGSL